MNSLFQVGAKLLGIISISRAFMSIGNILMVIAQAKDPKFQFFSSFFPFALVFFVYLIFGYFLTFKTDTIEKLINIKKISENIPSFSINSILRVGLILIGAFFIITHLPNFIRYIGYFIQKQFEISPYFAGELIGMIISVIFIISPNKIINFIDKKS